VFFLGGTAHVWSCVSSVYHFFLLFGYWLAPAFLVLWKFCVRLPHQHCRLALMICCFDPSHLRRTVSDRTRTHVAWGLRALVEPHPTPTSLEKHRDASDWVGHVRLQRNLTCMRRVVVRTTCHVRGAAAPLGRAHPSGGEGSAPRDQWDLLCGRRQCREQSCRITSSPPGRGCPAQSGPIIGPGVSLARPSKTCPPMVLESRMIFSWPFVPRHFPGLGFYALVTCTQVVSTLIAAMMKRRGVTAHPANYFKNIGRGVSSAN